MTTDRIPFRAVNPEVADGTYSVSVADGVPTLTGSGGTGTGIVETIVPGAGIEVDDTDPANPIVSATAGGGGSSAVYEGVAWPIDRPPASPNAMDDEFSGTSLDAKWTATRGTTAAPTISVADGVMTFDAAAEAGWKIQGLTQPVPAAGDWTFILAVAASDSPLGNYLSPALIGLSEGSSGATGKIQVLGLTRFAGSTIQITYGTSWSAFSSSPYNAEEFGGSLDGYLRVAKVGTTYTWSYSRTGKKWYTLSTGALPFTPGRVVIGGKSENSTISPQGIFKWFRRTA